MADEIDKVSELLSELLRECVARQAAVISEKNAEVSTLLAARDRLIEQMRAECREKEAK